MKKYRNRYTGEVRTSYYRPEGVNWILLSSTESYSNAFDSSTSSWSPSSSDYSSSSDFGSSGGDFGGGGSSGDW